MVVVDCGTDWRGVTRQICLPPWTKALLPVKSETQLEGIGKLGVSQHGARTVLHEGVLAVSAERTFAYGVNIQHQPQRRMKIFYN
jgi:hypothetical protein